MENWDGLHQRSESLYRCMCQKKPSHLSLSAKDSSDLKKNYVYRGEVRLEAYPHSHICKSIAIAPAPHHPKLPLTFN